MIEPIAMEDLTPEELCAAMEAVSLIKEKRSGVVKGRTCANGSKQKRYLRPDDNIALPTASTEAIIATFMIDAHERRNVGVVDIPGAYLHAEMEHEDGRVVMVFRNEFVDLLCKVDKKYKPFVCIVNGRKVLFVKVLRAIYRCIKSALLWYKLFSTTLENMGFKINPYDRCVANKIVNGKQCTIVWYVDNVKVSHVQQSVVEML